MRWKEGTKVYCQICGREIERRPNQQKGDYLRRKTCGSTECKGKLKKLNTKINTGRKVSELTLEEVQKEYLFSLNTREEAAKILNTTPSVITKFLTINNLKKDKKLLYPEKRMIPARKENERKWKDEEYRKAASKRMNIGGDIYEKHRETYNKWLEEYKNEIIQLIKENSDKQKEELAVLFSRGRSTFIRTLKEFPELAEKIPTRYNFQKEVKEFLEENNIEFEENCRSILTREGKYPLEVDFYISEAKVAIECNGYYWHSARVLKDKNYHYNKTKSCEEKGIRLIHIWQYEWENERQRPILKNIILNACKKLDSSKRIYARKCEIRILPALSIKNFFLENNIQGYRNAKDAICLFYNNELVMSYALGPAFLSRGKYDIEVARGATKLGYQVIGGASKLWKYITKTYMPEKGYKSCIYYIDYNYFSGNSLKNMEGLKFLSSQISFKNYWVKEKKIKNRDPKNNSLIKSLVEKGDVDIYWNVGTKTYVYEA